MKLFLVALLLCGASGHGFMDQSNVTLFEYLSKKVSPLPDSNLQLSRCFSDSQLIMFDVCSAASPDQLMNSTSSPHSPLRLAAKCIAESLNAWDNSTNSTNKTLLQAALIERSNLSEEQKKNVADSMKECITSDKVKGGKKNWRVRYNQNEKCGSLKSLVCAARSFFASGCAALPSDVGADSPDQDQVSAAIRMKVPDTSSEENGTTIPPKRNQPRKTKEDSSRRNSPRGSGNKNRQEGCHTSGERRFDV